jgi:hypothetical protein
VARALLPPAELIVEFCLQCGVPAGGLPEALSPVRPVRVEVHEGIGQRRLDDPAMAPATDRVDQLLAFDIGLEHQACPPSPSRHNELTRGAFSFGFRRSSNTTAGDTRISSSRARSGQMRPDLGDGERSLSGPPTLGASAARSGPRRVEPLDIPGHGERDAVQHLHTRPVRG